MISTKRQTYFVDFPEKTDFPREDQTSTTSYSLVMDLNLHLANKLHYLLSNVL